MLFRMFLFSESWQNTVLQQLINVTLLSRKCGGYPTVLSEMAIRDTKLSLQPTTYMSTTADHFPTLLIPELQFAYAVITVGSFFIPGISKSIPSLVIVGSFTSIP